jgi:hypothetical protein
MQCPHVTGSKARASTLSMSFMETSMSSMGMRWRVPSLTWTVLNCRRRRCSTNNCVYAPTHLCGGALDAFMTHFLVNNFRIYLWAYFQI